MTITTNNSSSVMNIDDLVNYVLNDLPEFTQKNIHEDHTYYNHVQSPTKGTASTLHTLTTKIKKTKKEPFCKKTFELHQSMKNEINRLRQKTKESLEKIQTTYSNKLNVDIQNVEKIYSAVPLFSPITQKTSEIKIIQPLSTFPSEWLVPPESKKEMVDGINRIFQRTKSSLEEIQTYYANKLNVDIQDIKNIYSAVSNKEQSANESSLIETLP